MKISYDTDETLTITGLTWQQLGALLSACARCSPAPGGAVAEFLDAVDGLVNGQPNGEGSEAASERLRA